MLPKTVLLGLHLCHRLYVTNSDHFDVNGPQSCRILWNYAK